MHRTLILSLVACLALAPWASCQSVTITPNPAPIDQGMTIRGTGFMAYSPVMLWWDADKSTQSCPAGNITGIHPTTDAAGSFTVPLDFIPFFLWPANAGKHTLTVGYMTPWTSGLLYGQVAVELAPRTGWAAAAPLPKTAAPGFAGGVLAYLKSNADDTATSLMVSDGAASQVLGTLSTADSYINQPTWSPDGSRLAFGALADTSPSVNIYTLDRLGRVTQVTPHGGKPPVLTGGGAGALEGSILPAEFPQVAETQEGDLQRCLDMVLDFKTHQPMPPKGIWVTLVGTGKVAIATSEAVARGENGPYLFSFSNLPEGDYWLHAWYTAQICQEDQQVVARNPDDNTPPTKRIVRVSIGTANAGVPIHITAGQVTRPNPIETLYGWTSATNPTWVDAQRLIYVAKSGVYSHSGEAVADAYLAGAAPEPVALSSPTVNGKVDMLDTSPVTARTIGYSEKVGGLFVTELATFSSQAKAVTAYWSELTTLGTGYNDYSPAWSPDGSYVAFIRRDLLQVAPTPPNSTKLSDLIRSLMAGAMGDLWIKDVGTGAEWPLVRCNIVGGEGVLGRPAWSPDRRQIAVTYTRDNVKNTDLRLINVADGTSVAFTQDGRSSSPTWTAAARLGDYAQNTDLAPKVTGAIPPAALPGDTDADGKLSIKDALAILRYVGGFITPTAAQRSAADANADGKLDVRDAILVLKKVAGL